MIGQTLDGCLIERELTKTSTGIVYLAQDEILTVPRAVKIIDPNLAKRDYIQERFRLSLHPWAKLEHPNFVHIFAAIQQKNTLGYVIDFIDGVPLFDILKKQGKLSVTQAGDYLLGIAKALSFAHENGIIHRKLSPYNIMITKDENIKIMGLSALRNMSHQRITPQNVCVGKVLYMPPEQFTGQYSPKSDQYTLGAIMYEMLAGQKPYMAKNIPELYRTILTTIPKPIRKINKDVNPELEHIILKMLAKKPENRFESMTEIVNETIKATDRIDYSAEMNVLSLMYQGRRSLERRKLENAIYFFNKLLSQYGKESEYYTEAHEKRYEASLLLKEEHDIREIRDLIIESLAAFDEEEFDEAGFYLEKIVGIMRDHPESTRIKGLRMDILREMPEILTEKSNELDDKIAKSKNLTEKAKTLYVNGEYAEAFDIFKEALDYDHKNKLAKKLKNIAEKKIEIQKSVKRLVAGIKSYKEGNYDEAISHFSKHLNINPKDELAQKYITMAEEEKEEEATKRISIEKFYKEGQELYEKWNYTKAMKKFEQVLKLDPKHQRSSRILNEIKGRLDEDNQIEDIGFFFRQGMEFYEDKKWKEAIKCFDHVLETMEGHKKALEYKKLAMSYKQKEEIFEQVMKDALFSFENDDYENAFERFDYLLKLEKDNEEVQKYHKLCKEFLKGHS